MHAHMDGVTRLHAHTHTHRHYIGDVPSGLGLKLRGLRAHILRVRQRKETENRQLRFTATDVLCTHTHAHYKEAAAGPKVYVECPSRMREVVDAIKSRVRRHGQPRQAEKRHSGAPARRLAEAAAEEASRFDPRHH